MNKTEFVGKLQMVYVGDKNASADIIAEYDKLNKSLDVATEMINNKQKEIVRLNNIINELEKYIKFDIKVEIYGDKTGLRNFADVNDILDKLKELKEEND